MHLLFVRLLQYLGWHQLNPLASGYSNSTVPTIHSNSFPYQFLKKKFLEEKIHRAQESFLLFWKAPRLDKKGLSCGKTNSHQFDPPRNAHRADRASKGYRALLRT